MRASLSPPGACYPWLPELPPPKSKGMRSLLTPRLESRSLSPLVTVAAIDVPNVLVELLDVVELVLVLAGFCCA